MARQRHPFIAREGWPFIALAVIGAVAAWLALSDTALLFAVLALAFAFKFRDPERTIPAEPLGVVSPVDGVVTLVEEADDPALNRRALRIRLRVAFFGARHRRALD